MSITNRVVTIKDLANFFEVPVGRLERIVLRHGIAPAFRVGRVRAYGPEQARRIDSVLNGF